MLHAGDEPVFVFGCQLHRGRPFAKRELKQVLHAVLCHFLEDGRSAGIVRLTTPFAGVEVDPVPETQFKRPSVSHAGITQVGHGIDGNHGFQFGCFFHRECMLCTADIGCADHADLRIRPGLFPNPGRGIHAIDAVISQHMPDAFRTVAAAGVLRHKGVAVRGVIGARRFTAVFVVRSTFQNGGQFLIQHVAIFDGQINVSCQLHTIPHGDHDVLAHFHCIWTTGGECGSGEQ